MLTSVVPGLSYTLESLECFKKYKLWFDRCEVWPRRKNFSKFLIWFQHANKVEGHLSKIQSKNQNFQITQEGLESIFKMQVFRSHASAENVWACYCFKISTGVSNMTLTSPFETTQSRLIVFILYWQSTARWPGDQFNFFNVFFVDKAVQWLTE